MTVDHSAHSRAETWPRFSNSKPNAFSVNQRNKYWLKFGSNMSRRQSIWSNSVLYTLQSTHILGSYVKNKEPRKWVWRRKFGSDFYHLRAQEKHFWVLALRKAWAYLLQIKEKDLGLVQAGSCLSRRNPCPQYFSLSHISRFSSVLH